MITKMSNAYLLHDDAGNWFMLLPNSQYKKIPYINWVEDVDWSVAYYEIYKSLFEEKITELDLFRWPIEKILRVCADIRL